jgi:hypothetical protein
VKIEWIFSKNNPSDLFTKHLSIGILWYLVRIWREKFCS